MAISVGQGYNAVAQFVGAGLGFATVLQGNPTLVQLLHPDGSSILLFDAVMQEQYDRAVQPTGFPVEDGANISDHAIQAPFALSMTGLVSDTPLNAQDFFSDTAASPALTAPLGVVGTALAFATWQAHQGSDRPSLAAYATLCRLMTGDPTQTPPTPPLLVTVQTLIGAFQNMLLTQLSAPRDAQTGGALVFQMSFTQLTVVGTQTLAVASIPALAAARASLGDQDTDLEGVNGFDPGRVSGRIAGGRPLP